jgi:hypothetical protein
VRRLVDWLTIGQVVPHNPESAVLGSKHVVKVGKTRVLDASEGRTLLDSVPIRHSGTELSEQPMTQPDAWHMIRRPHCGGRHTCADRWRRIEVSARQSRNDRAKAVDAG